MPKINLLEMEKDKRFLLMMVMQTVLNVKKAHNNKNWFMSFVESVWDTVEKNGEDKISELLAELMAKDLKDFALLYDREPKNVLTD